MDSLRRQVDWLFLLSLSTVILTVSASAVLVDDATVSLFEQKNFQVEEELASNSKPTENQRSDKFADLEITTSNVFNDLCHLHGNLLDFSVTSSQNQTDKNRLAIDVLHEIFDPSFGLVPYVSYTSKAILPLRYLNHG
jgi:hypothetical protein